MRTIFCLWTLNWIKIKGIINIPITLSSEATVTSKSSIVSKLFTPQISDLLCLIAYYWRFFHAKFQHSRSSSLASTSFWSKEPFFSFQFFILDIDGDLSLKTYITSKRFELELWDWSQIEDFLKEIIVGSRKNHTKLHLLRFFMFFPWFFLFKQHLLLKIHLLPSWDLIIIHKRIEKRFINDKTIKWDQLDYFKSISSQVW